VGFPSGDEFLVVAAAFAVWAGDLGQGGGVDGAVELAVPASMLLWFTNRGVGAGLVCEPVLVSGGEVVVVSDASFEL